jgi:hypothetical protein
MTMNIPSSTPPALRDPRAARLARGGDVTASLEACITGSYENGKVCGELPFVGKKCFHVGGPNITAAAKICVSPSFFPPGVSACVYVNNTKLGCVSI